MAELKISDLSIGDWVEFHRTKGIWIALPLFDKAYAQVIGTHRGAEVSLLVDGKREFIAMPLSAIQPIPITPEILEKNGWSEFSDYHNSWRLDIASDKRVWMFKNSHDWTFQVMSWGLGHNHSVAKAYIKDIHELQHALRLAGVEKKIEL